MRDDHGGDGDSSMGGLLRRVRRRWSASSIFAKLGVVAMPIFVAAVGVVVIARNRRILRDVSALDGARSARLAQFIANPASFEPTSPSFDRTLAIATPVASPRQCEPLSWYEGEVAEIKARIKRGELLLTPGRAGPCIPLWEFDLKATELKQVLAVLPRPRDDGRWIDWFHVARDDLDGETPYAALIHGQVARVVFAAQQSLRQTSR